MRVKVEDKIGVLSDITSILGKHDISIDSFLQKQDKQDNSSATLLFSTHKSIESNVKKAIEEIKKLSTCRENPVMIRIED